MKSSDAKASKCHLKFSSRMIIFIKLVYLSSVISLKLQLGLPINCHLSEITELEYISLIKIFNGTWRLLHLNSSNVLLKLWFLPLRKRSVL